MSFSHFDESDLCALETAYRRAVAELGIPVEDEAGRLRVAQLVMAIVKVETVIVPSRIGSEAARRFRAELGTLMLLVPSESVLVSVLSPGKRSQ